MLNLSQGEYVTSGWVQHLNTFAPCLPPRDWSGVHLGSYRIQQHLDHIFQHPGLCDRFWHLHGSLFLGQHPDNIVVFLFRRGQWRSVCLPSLVPKWILFVQVGAQSNWTIVSVLECQYCKSTSFFFFNATIIKNVTTKPIMMQLKAIYLCVDCNDLPDNIVTMTDNLKFPETITLLFL